MAYSTTNLMYPMRENRGTDKFELTIEKFEGTVHETYQKASILESVYNFTPLVGTDTMSNAAMGNPTLAKVEAGVEAAGQDIKVGKMIVQVKQPIIARVTTPMLADVQSHLDIKGKTPGNFGKKIAKSIDEVLFVQIVKSIVYDHALASGGTNATEGTGGILPIGVVQELAGASDELDTAKLTSAIYAANQALHENDIDVAMGDGKLYMAPAQYFTLLKNQDLMSRDFNKENGSYAHAAIDVASGMPVVMTNRIMDEEDTVADPAAARDSVASLYDQGDTLYETTATMAKCKAAFANSDTIMVAQSIPLTTDVYWDKRLLTWFIDAYLAIGAAPDRTDTCAGIFGSTYS